MTLNSAIVILAAALLLTTAAAVQAQPPAPPLPRTVLRDVPRIGYDVHLCPFPGSLYSCLKHLGDPCDYDYLMGVSGAAFRRLWNRDDGGNVDLMYLAPEPHRRALEALGYQYRVIQRNRTAMVAAIKESISRDCPVISFGIIGPPEAGLVTGYDGDGTMLYGWSYFQDGSKPGYYELEGWLERMSEGPPFGLIVVGEKKPALPDAREVLLQSLEWAVDLARRPKRPGLPNHVSGLAAYDAWADGLGVDADYPPNDQKVMETRAMVHCDQVVMLHERHSAARYLRKMADVVPDVAQPLNAAASLYDETGDLAGKVWRWGHWQQPEALKGMSDTSNRREFARHVRAAKEKELRAVEQLESALTALRAGVKPLAAVSHLELQWSKLVNYPPEFRPNIEGMPVPSILRALTEFIGEDFGFTTDGNWRTNQAFPFFMGVWGDAFEFVWLRKEGEPARDEPPPSLVPLPQRFATTLSAAGFDCEVLLRPDPTKPATVAAPFEAAACRRLVESIADRGWPALVDMPGLGRVFLATGYGKGGDVLIGWDVEGGDDRGVRFEAEKQLAVSDWFAKASCVVLLTGKHARPPEKSVYCQALEQGAQFLRAREVGHWHAGPATFDAWAKSLKDPNLSAGDATTAKRRAGILDPMIWDLATRRHYGNLFLTRAVQLFPAAAAELQAAAACFRAEHDMMWEVNRLGGAKWPGEELPRLADANVRKQIAELLLKSRDKDLEAASHIERALQTVKNR